MISAWMRDIVELRGLPQRYARAADARDVDGLAHLFHPEAVVNGTRGEQSIADWLEGMRGPKAFPTSMHMLGDPLIDLPEGGDQGTLDTYAVVYQLGDQQAGQGDLTLGLRYLDTVVRYGDGWVIKDRTVTTLWMR